MTARFKRSKEHHKGHFHIPAILARLRERRHTQCLHNNSVSYPSPRILHVQRKPPNEFGGQNIHISTEWKGIEVLTSAYSKVIETKTSTEMQSVQPLPTSPKIKPTSVCYLQIISW